MVGRIPVAALNVVVAAGLGIVVLVVAAAVGLGAVGEAIAAALGLVKMAVYQTDSLVMLLWATIVELMMDLSSASSSL